MNRMNMHKEEKFINRKSMCEFAWKILREFDDFMMVSGSRDEHVDLNHRNVDYSLVNLNKKLWNITIFNGKFHYVYGHGFNSKLLVITRG